MIYKSSIRSHLDYGDTIYDQAYNVSFQTKLKGTQYNAVLAITEAMRGTSKAKLFEELGLESLQHRRWYKKLSCFIKIWKINFQSFYVIPMSTTPYYTRNANNISHFKVKHDFKNTLFSSVIIESNKLDPKT